MKIKDIVKQISVYATSPFVAFSIGAVVVMLLDVYVTKGIDSSFVSACMDVVMAGAAVGAVIVARNYLAQFTAQEGYKIAIDLVNNHLLSIKDDKIVEKEYLGLHNYITSISGESPQQKHLNEMKKRIKVVTTQCEKQQQYINEIDKILLQLKTYGIRVSIQKDECFTEIREYLDKANFECNDLINKANYLIGIMENLYEQNVRDNPTSDTSGGLPFNLENFKGYTLNDKNILVANLDNAISSLDEFISGDGSIIKLFTTN
ncbi:TPA: hypothetical protein PXM79_004097 [Yersinia enterocolitica]|nr:hypothetical protein [Yersinia enterocolitica]